MHFSSYLRREQGSQAWWKNTIGGHPCQKYGMGTGDRTVHITPGAAVLLLGTLGNGFNGAEQDGGG